MKILPFFLVFAVAVFAAGFLAGYFLDRSSIAYTQGNLDELRVDIENTQIQELFASGENFDCGLMFTSLGSISYNLFDQVNKLREASSKDIDFHSLKRQADFLSIRAWIIARNIRLKCTDTILPILHIYSGNRPLDRIQQEGTLQKAKDRYSGVLVYSIDGELDEPVIRLIKDAYGIGEAEPSLIINHTRYGLLNETQLDALVCGLINCTTLPALRASPDLPETGPENYCDSDSDCWCRNFDGAKFLPGRGGLSGCNMDTNRCKMCYYE
ncbi:MAG: hypothetical protein HY518_03290 [Candidatus Aenigmarchaeota archaeon]|nr:hypothetical protein [Candidatus Aenigmarchaeota archaeon]